MYIAGWEMDIRHSHAIVRRRYLAGLSTRYRLFVHG